MLRWSIVGCGVLLGCLLIAGGAVAASAPTLPSNLCPALDTPGANHLPWCSTEPLRDPGATMACPGADRWAVLIDNDALTAKANASGAKVNATNWSELLTWLQKLPRASCAGGGRDPIDLVPKNCANIQAFAGGRGALSACRQGDLLFPRYGGGGGTTPAVEAVRWSGTQLQLSRQDLILVAFDGVVDGNYDRESPSAAFAQAVGEVAATGAVAVVASPQRYRYVYILASLPYARYAGALAEKLAALWNARGSGEGPAFALRTSGDGLLTPGWRSATAKVHAAGLPITGRPEWRYGEVPLYRSRDHASYWVDPVSWLAQRQPAGVAFRLHWNASEDVWMRDRPVGVRQPPPEVWANRELAALPPAKSSWTTDGTVATQQLLECPATATSQSARRATPLFQDVHTSAGHADLLLFRGLQSSLTWLRDWSKDVIAARPGGSQRPVPDPICTVGSDDYRRTFAGTERAGAANLALVAPAPVIDPCLDMIEDQVRGSHLWGSQDSSQLKLARALGAAECKPASWGALVESLAATAPRPFPPGSEGFARGNDARIGMETFLRAMEEVARGSLRRMVAEPEMAPCILGTLRVNDVDFRPAPGGPELLPSAATANPCARP